MMMMSTQDIFDKLKLSKFRSRFHLKEKDFNYINEKGIDTIKSHAYDFINKRLKPLVIPNDGKQTPMRGHPVFIAQHACACCCRGCLFKWHHIEKNKELSDSEVDYIVNFLMTWINNEVENERKNN